MRKSTHVRWLMHRTKPKSLDLLPRSTKQMQSSSNLSNRSTSQTTKTTASACLRTRPCLRILSELWRLRLMRTSLRNCNVRAPWVTSWVFSDLSSHLWSLWPLLSASYASSLEESRKRDRTHSKHTFTSTWPWGLKWGSKSWTKK